MPQQVLTIHSDAPFVAVHDLHKRYRTGTAALRGITINVNKGDLFGLIGPDGAGKSTLLRILSGVMEPTSGEALILGHAPRDARRNISYVPQNCALYPELTVEETLRYQAGLYGISGASFAKLRHNHLTDMGLLKFSNRLAGNLSGGMKQKLALCCALVTQPQLILLDEPTTGLDPIARRDLWQVLAGLAHQGVTAVIATPFLDEAERCNRIALMHEGTIHQTGTPDDLEEALLMRRLEITIAKGHNQNDIWNILKAAKFAHINDMYMYGDHLEILSEDVNSAERELRDALSAGNVAIESANETAPNMENVFVMRLRELGQRESQLVPFPNIRTRQTSDGSSHQGDVAILAQGLIKNFGEFRAVDNVGLEIGYGDIYGLLGANGAGKTTTIKMLCGLMKPTKGTVSLAGQSRDLRSAAVCKKIGYMSQKFTLYDGLTVEENLQFYASIYEIPLALRKRQIDWVTQACELQDIVKSVVGKLPLGWKQRIAFGAAVMHDPDILFLDEPTAGVDPLARRQLWSLIRAFAHNGAAILVTTHYLDEAEYCDRLAFMDASKIVTQGSPREIKSHFLGQVIEVRAENVLEVNSALSGHLDQCRVSTHGGCLHVLLETMQNGVETVQSMLQDTGCATTSIRPIPCSLEDAFIDIVQRSRKEAA